ncbi:MAG TPA: hypothetical protein VNZ52_10140, partial [Candidatus Thermoplasmatota archaeon]|nr:hypothetical protein [Candidatus Thermoplasmatota archaeon]
MATADLTEQQVVNHLLFHKAILQEEDTTDRINGYLKIVKERGEGAHVNIEDPFDKSIALAFELVLERHLDPWNIDLVQFATLYANRLKSEKDVDLITAGRLMLMAWTILKLQT